MNPFNSGNFVDDPVSKLLHSPKNLDITLNKQQIESRIEKPAAKIIAAMPAYNEEEYIGSMVLGVSPYVDEVIVLDDGSTDRTVRFAEMAGARVISHQTNMGKGKAIQTVLEEAKKMDIDMLVLLDSDCQHNPDEIPSLLEPLINGEVDIVNGSRFLDKKSKIPYYRTIGQHFLTFSTNLSAGTSITDSQNGFRALSKKAINTLQLKENGMGVESEMIHRAHESDLKIKEVPISCRYDVNGSTLNPVSHGLHVMGAIVNQLQRKHPLLYFALPGFILFLIGLSLSLQTLFAYSMLGEFLIEKALVGGILLLVGVVAMFTGLMLNSLAMMLKELKTE